MLTSKIIIFRYNYAGLTFEARPSRGLPITIVLVTGGAKHLRPIPQHEDNRKPETLKIRKIPRLSQAFCYGHSAA